MIIWDEIGMPHRRNLEAVDGTLREICNVHFPFGGKTMLTPGDSLQIVPVIEDGPKGQILQSTLKWYILYGVHERLI